MKQENVPEQDPRVYDLSKLDELSHKIKRARYSEPNADLSELESAAASTSQQATPPPEQSAPKSIQSLFRSQSLESKQSTAEGTERKLSLKDSTNTSSATNLDAGQSRTWFKPPLPASSKTKTVSMRKNESIEETKENLAGSRQYRSASLGKEGIFQFTQKSLSSSLQALVSGKLNETSFNTLERALNIIRAYDLQNLEPDNAIYELLDAIDDQDFKKAVPLANAFLDDEYKKLLSSVDLLDEQSFEDSVQDEEPAAASADTLQVPNADQKEMKKQSSFEKQQLELQQLEESVDIEELIDLIPDEQSILSKKFRESDLVLLRKLRSMDEDDSPEKELQKDSSLSLSDKLTIDLNNNNLTSFEFSDYPESLRLDMSSELNRSVSRSPAPEPRLQYKQNASIQTEKSFLLTQRMHTINAIVKEISRPEFVEDALCSSPTESSYSGSQSQTCNCSECTQSLQAALNRGTDGSPPKNDNVSLQSYETCPSMITSCSDEYCKRRQSMQSEMYFTCSEGSVSRCSTCSSLNSLENKMMVDRNNNQEPDGQPSCSSECDIRPVSVCESSSSTVTSRSTMDSVEAGKLIFRNFGDLHQSFFEKILTLKD